MGWEKYVGRVGGLAVALGIGSAIAAVPTVAWAAPDDTPSVSATAGPSKASADKPAEKPQRSGALAPARRDDETTESESSDDSPKSVAARKTTTRRRRRTSRQPAAAGCSSRCSRRGPQHPGTTTPNHPRRRRCF